MKVGGSGRERSHPGVGLDMLPRGRKLHGSLALEAGQGFRR